MVYWIIVIAIFALGIGYMIGVETSQGEDSEGWHKNRYYGPRDEEE